MIHFTVTKRVLTVSSWTVKSRTSIWSLFLSFSSLLARFLAWSAASSNSATRADSLRLIKCTDKIHMHCVTYQTAPMDNVLRHCAYECADKSEAVC